MNQRTLDEIKFFYLYERWERHSEFSSAPWGSNLPEFDAMIEMGERAVLPICQLYKRGLERKDDTAFVYFLGRIYYPDEIRTISDYMHWETNHEKSLVQELKDSGTLLWATRLFLSSNYTRQPHWFKYLTDFDRKQGISLFDKNGILCYCIRYYYLRYKPSSLLKRFKNTNFFQKLHSRLSRITPKIAFHIQS